MSNPSLGMSAGVDQCLVGAVDFHIHTRPDIFPRCVSAFEAASMAQQVGMGAIVVKSHSADTAARAAEAAERSGFPVFGGVALNYSVGGLNPYAVLECARQGGRVVWMPTICARHFVETTHYTGMLREGIPPGVEGLTVLGTHGITAEARNVLEAIVECDLVLCSGHLAPEETIELFGAAQKLGVRRLVVTHPQAPFVGMPVDVMRRVAAQGAFIELTPQLSVAERAEIIRAVGIEHCFISTDGGTTKRPPPVDGLREFVAGLKRAGFTDPEIRYLAVSVPSYLLGLDGWSDPPDLRKAEAARSN